MRHVSVAFSRVVRLLVSSRIRSDGTTHSRSRSATRTASGGSPPPDTTINGDHGGEIGVTLRDDTVSLNDVLQCLIQARIPVESFDRDQMSLNDAFLAMIEEVPVA